MHTKCGKIGCVSHEALLKRLNSFLGRRCEDSPLKDARNIFMFILKYPSLSGRRLKGKGKGVLGARETQGAPLAFLSRQERIKGTEKASLIHTLFHR